MNRLLKILTLFIIGGSTYYLIEFLFKTFISHGTTHWSMFIVGGLMFLSVGLINEILPWSMSIILQGIIGSIMITLVEFLSGCYLNLYLMLGIWDYSQLPFNILGQVCLQFSLIWIILSILAVVVDDYLRYWLFDEEKPHYRLI